MSNKPLKPASPVSPFGPARTGTDRNIVIPLQEFHSENLPTDSEFALLKAKREVKFLKGEIKQLHDAIRYKDSVLARQKHLWDLGLIYGEWPTQGEANTNLKRIEGAIEHQGKFDFEDKDKGKRRG